VGYALLAFSLGAFLGAVIRRTLPAILVTVVGFGVVRWVVRWVVRYDWRTHFAAPLVAPATTPFGAEVAGGWFLSAGLVAPRGVSVAHVLRRCAARPLCRTRPVARSRLHNVPRRAPCALRRVVPAGQPVLAVPGIRDSRLRRGGTAAPRRQVWAVRRWQA